MAAPAPHGRGEPQPDREPVVGPAEPLTIGDLVRRHRATGPPGSACSGFVHRHDEGELSNGLATGDGARRPPRPRRHPEHPTSLSRMLLRRRSTPRAAAVVPRPGCERPDGFEDRGLGGGSKALEIDQPVLPAGVLELAHGSRPRDPATVFRTFFGPSPGRLMISRTPGGTRSSASINACGRRPATSSCENGGCPLADALQIEDLPGGDQLLEIAGERSPPPAPRPRTPEPDTDSRPRPRAGDRSPGGSRRLIFGPFSGPPKSRSDPMKRSPSLVS